MMAVVTPTQNTLDQILILMFVLSVLGESGTTQSSSVSDSTFVGQVGSTLNTVPVTVMDDPLLTHEEKNVTKSSAE